MTMTMTMTAGYKSGAHWCLHRLATGWWLAMAALITLPKGASAKILQVGPGHRWNSIAAAVRAAHPGDIIKVWPLPDHQAYRRAAVLVNKPRITIESAVPGRNVVIDGAGFNYSGRGPIPRAIFQFNSRAKGCTLRGFNLTGAHNRAGNGAGVRINAANHVSIVNCRIFGNDMGIMSNGSYLRHTAAFDLIDRCRIIKNGTSLHAGYNHNLYLGGTSVLIRRCDIADSLTGHNLKSRAHLTWIEYCFIHGSANREIDLVDARGTTDQPRSNAVVLGCIIIKKRHMSGNHEVVNFGSDGGANHTGTLYFVHNTVITPYPTAAVVLSARGAHAVLIDNRLISMAHKATLLMFMNGASHTHVRGSGNRISKAYGAAARRYGGPLIAWKHITLPWPQLKRQPQPLMRLLPLEKIMPYRQPQAGAGPINWLDGDHHKPRSRGG